MERAVITVVGKDTIGIIAKVCAFLADSRINILDISQTIVQGYFNMMMIVDLGQSTLPFSDLTAKLGEIGRSIGVEARCQREDIFDRMHRV